MFVVQETTLNSLIIFDIMNIFWRIYWNKLENIFLTLGLMPLIFNYEQFNSYQVHKFSN